MTLSAIRRNCAASAGRPRGSRLVAIATSRSISGGTPATICDGGGTGSLTCLYATASGVSPVCGLAPVSSSNKTMPAA